ncbi:MAG: ABC transporter ATP-binding protein [Polyangiaceae bacterium]
MKPHVEIWNLVKSFTSPDGGVQTVVKDFTLNLAKGEFVSIIGHSGCGKSTVLHILAGLSEATEGVVILDGKEVKGPSTDRGVVFQAPCLLHWLTAEQNVSLGLEQVMPSASRKERSHLACEFLRRVGLGGYEGMRPAELSAGMRQRVGLARAFALSPKMLLLDEPFGMLDSLTRFDLQDVLVEVWSKQRMTAVMVTHDVDEALFLSDRVVMMTSGPNAHVGEIVTVPFARPRLREQVIQHPEYFPLRERLLDFLESQSHPRAPTVVEATVIPSGEPVLGPA